MSDSVDWDALATVRPASLPPQTRAEGPPNEGGPWTKLHEAIDLDLRGQLAKLEATRGGDQSGAEQSP